MPYSLLDNRSANITRTGRTTRLIDFYIQELFTKPYIHITDHVDTPERNRRLAEKVANRLMFEHGKKLHKHIFDDKRTKYSLLETISGN